MKNTVKIILEVLLALSCAAVITIAMIGSGRNIERRRCIGLNVVVTDCDSIKFTDGEGIRQLIDSAFGGYVNVPSTDIDLFRMEELLNGQDYIDNAVCWTTPDGYVNVRMTQVSPAAKCYSDGRLVYITEKGVCIDCREDWKSKLLLIGGSPDLSDRILAKQLGEAGVCIGKDARFHSRIDTLECTDKGECIIHLHGRTEKFLAGKPVNVKAKLDKLNKYETGVHGEYSTVDLCYKGQIICK